MDCKINVPFQLCCQLPVNEKITMLEQVATHTFTHNNTQRFTFRAGCDHFNNNDMLLPHHWAITTKRQKIISTIPASVYYLSVHQQPQRQSDIQTPI